MKAITYSSNSSRKGFWLGVLAGASLALLGTAVPASADTPITACGYVITAPGNYGVAADLTCAANVTAVTINASNVTLKLNGYIITGSGIATAGGGIVVSPLPIPIPPPYPPQPRLNHVGIAGPGLIQAFQAGVTIINTDYSQVSGVTAAHNGEGFFALDNTYLTVTSNQFVANTGGGMNTGSNTSSTFSYNDVSGNGYGLWLAAGSGNTVNNNTARGNGGDGITIADNYTRVYSNVTNGNGTGASGGDGIDLYFTQFQGDQPYPFFPTGNQFFNNTSAVGNGTFDIQDQTACGLNYWSNDVFFIANTKGSRGDAVCVR